MMWNTFPHTTTNFFINIDRHYGIPMPVAWHIGVGLLGWAHGEDNKNNEGKILADNDTEEVVSLGHRVYRLVLPHLNIPPWPPNLLIPLIIPFSQSECKFAVHSVEGKDGPIAVSIFKIIGLNEACFDPVSCPSSIVFNYSTVLLGFTLSDFLKGVLSIAIDIFIDLVFLGAFALLGKSSKFLKNKFKFLNKISSKKIITNILKKGNIPRKFNLKVKLSNRIKLKGVSGSISTEKTISTMTENLSQSIIREKVTDTKIVKSGKDIVEGKKDSFIDSHSQHLESSEKKIHSLVNKGSEMVENMENKMGSWINNNSETLSAWD